jgi:SsrA-binding protein
MPTELTTPRLHLDAWRDDDIDDYDTLVNERDPRTAAAPHGGRPTRDELRETILRQQASHADTGIGLLVIRTADRFAGYCGLTVGRASLAEAYAVVENGEAWVLQLHIPPYEQGNRWNLEPTRRRKLLLHHTEITRLEKAVAQKGQAIIPLKLYFARGYAKLLLGIAKGKKTVDKRHTIAERDAKREMDRARRSGGKER